MRTYVRFKANCNVVYSCTHHVVWCPKYRLPVLVDGVDTRLKGILCEAANELESEIVELEVMPDHVRLLCQVDPQFGIHRLLRQQFPHLRQLPSLWSNSYPSTSLRPGFVASVGGAPLAVIKQYIEQQKESRWARPRRHPS